MRVTWICLLVAGATTLGAQDKPNATQTIAKVPAGVSWTVVETGDYRAKLPQLAGKYVEIRGGMRTMMGVRRDNSFTNTGWIIASDGKEAGTLLFDQASDEAIDFMNAQRCHATCESVFMRGIIVKRPGGTSNVFRLIEASLEPKSGMQTPAMKALAALGAADPNASKPLLPSGAVPTKSGGLPAAEPAAVQQAAAPADTSGAKKLFGRLKSAGIVKTAEKEEKAPKVRADFQFGDPPVRETAYRNVRDTELYQLFKDHHWNTGRTMWPRVALIVEEMPKGHTTSFANPVWGSDVRNGCWKISAKLWMGPEASKDVAPFNWCLSEATYDSVRISPSRMAYGLSYEGVALWGSSPKTMFSDQNSGPQRTTGPRPPATATPRFYYQMDSNADAVMLGNILRDMAFSYGVADGRVWVINPAKPEP